jgi:hypothetical protein
MVLYFEAKSLPFRLTKNNSSRHLGFALVGVWTSNLTAETVFFNGKMLLMF